MFGLATHHRFSGSRIGIPYAFWNFVRQHTCAHVYQCIVNMFGRILTNFCATKSTHAYTICRAIGVQFFVKHTIDMVVRTNAKESELQRIIAAVI